MWKIIAGFIVFAAVALFVVFKGGDKLDMQGETGGHVSEASAHASAPTPVAAASAPAK